MLSPSDIIEGLDKKWTAIRENNLRINALPYGSYTLRIKGQSLKGEQSAGELTIPVVVIKPFYLQTWFLLCSVLVLSLLIYAVFRWRLQHLKQAKILSSVPPRYNRNAIPRTSLYTLFFRITYSAL